MKKTFFRMMPTASLLVSLAVIGLTAAMQGCESSGQSDYTDPTTRALADPMDYQPNMDKSESIISSDPDSFDKSGFQRDVDHVLNP